MPKAPGFVFAAPSRAASSSKHLRALLGALLLSAVSWGCESKVTASNPYDLATDPSQRAPASLAGRVVLDDPETEIAEIVHELQYVRVGLMNSDGAVVAGLDGSPLQAYLQIEDADPDGHRAKARFEFTSLAAGSYKVHVEGVGRRFTSSREAWAELQPGLRADVGDIVFTAIPSEGHGPGSIGGLVKIEGGVGGDRLVELYRLSGERALLYRQDRTEAQADGSGVFSFQGLPIGSYSVAAVLDGFTPDYKVDIRVGETGDASLNHVFAGEESMVLFPVTAVLIPAVQQTEGNYYLATDELPLSVLAFGGVTDMRISTDLAFMDDEGEPLPFVRYSASTIVALPDRQGPIEVYAQFETRSAEGFVFVSPTFSTTVVRDVTAPVVVGVRPLGASANLDGSYFVSPGTTLEIDALDEHSAIAGVAVVYVEEGAEPQLEDLVFDSVASTGGLARITKPAPLPDADGTHEVVVFVRDRAGNVSEPFELVLKIDRQAPALPLHVTNASDGILTSRRAHLEFDETGEEDLPVTMQVGQAPLRSTVPLIPYEQEIEIEIPSHGHGAVLAFEARLIDAAGNAALVRSDNVVLTLTGTIQGRIVVEGVPLLRPNHGGVPVSLRSIDSEPDDPAVAEAVSAADGRFSFSSVPEAQAYFLQIELPGYSTVEQLVPGVLANQQLSLPAFHLRLETGALVGRFSFHDRLTQDDAHAGILVVGTLTGSSRSHTSSTFTAPSGDWELTLPVTLEGEDWQVLAIHQGYANAPGGAHQVSTDIPTIVQPKEDDPSEPSPISLHPISGDFVLCSPSDPSCAPLTYTNLDQVRVKLANISQVSEVRARARVPFGADDVEPPFVAFDPASFTVDVSGPEGELVVFVQAKVAGEPGDVFSGIIVRDTVPPQTTSFVVDPGPDSLDPHFTRAASVRATLQADAGTDGSTRVAPLAASRLVFSETEPAAPPNADFVACMPGATCPVPLPLSGPYPEERIHYLYAFACDLAGNCAEAPVSTHVIYDRTPPSATHGVALRPVGPGIANSGETNYALGPNYSVELDLGHAMDSLSQPFLGLDEEALPDVVAYRLSIDDPFMQGTQVNLLTGTLEAGSTRTIPGPPLPSLDGTYRVYAQLYDAAGNRTSIEPNTFHFDLVLDTTAPAVSFSLENGATVTANDTVVMTVGFDPLDPPVRAELSTDGGLFQSVDVRDFPFAPGEDTFLLPADAPPAGDGLYTVHARFFDEAGNFAHRQASILLDRTPPEALLVRCLSCTVHPDGLFTQERQLSLELLAADAGGAVKYSHLVVRDAQGGLVDSASPAYSRSATVLLGEDDGVYDVEVSFEDSAGNHSDPVVLSVTLDREIPPFGLSIVGSDGHTGTTGSQTVTLTLHLEDPGHDDVEAMLVSNLATFSGASWEPLRLAREWHLAPGDGTKHVHVAIRDRAGNVAESSVSIILDQTPPNAPALQNADVTGDGFSLDAEQVELAWSHPAGASSFNLQRLITGTNDPSISDDFVTIHSVAAPATTHIDTSALPGYPHHYRVQAIDEVGNASDWSNIVTVQPFEPVTRALLMRDANDDFLVTYQIPRGTFSIGGYYDYKDILGGPFTSALVHNLSSFQRPPDPLWQRYDERLVLRVNNSANDLVYEPVLPLAIQQRQFVHPSSTTYPPRPTLALGVDGAAHVSFVSDYQTVNYATNASGEWVVTVLDDSAGLMWSLTGVMMALDAEDRPHVVYRNSADSTERKIIYANKVSGEWQSEVVVTGTTVRGLPAIAIDSAGFAHIVHYCNATTTFLYATNSSGGWVLSPLFTAASTSSQPRIVVDEHDQPHVLLSHGTSPSSRLRYATFDGVDWHLEEVDFNDALDGYFALDSVGRAHVAYRRRSEASLYYATNQSGGWVTTKLVEQGIALGSGPSLALDAFDDVFIAFHDVDLRDLRFLTNSSGEWQEGRIDAHGEVGEYPSIAIDTQGVHHVAYHDRSRNFLRYARHASHSGMSAMVGRETGDSQSGIYNDISVDRFGSTHILYRNHDEGSLEYATNKSGKWLNTTLVASGLGVGADSLAITTDAEGAVHFVAANASNRLRYWTNRTGSWVARTVDSQDRAERYPSIVIDSSGRAHIAYQVQVGPGGSAYLRYATFLGSWTREEIEGGTFLFGGITSIALDADENPHIIYSDAYSAKVRYATKASGDWVTMEVDGQGTLGGNRSFGIDAEGRLHVAYRGSADADHLFPHLKYATYADGVWSFRVVDAGENVGASASLAVDESGAVYVVYRDEPNQSLKVATNALGRWSIGTLDATANVGVRTSIDLDPRGSPQVSYYDRTNGRIRHGSHFLRVVTSTSAERVQPW